MTDLKNTQQLEKFKILLIGDSCIDEYQYGIVDRISPEAPVPVFNVIKKENKPGMAANVYENLKALGVDCTFKTNSSRIVKTRFIDQRSGQHLLRVDNEQTVNAFSDSIRDLESFDAVLISDYDKGFVTNEFVSRLRKHYHGPVFVDTKKTDLTKFDGCIIKINRLEHSRITAMPSSDTDLIVTQGGEGAMWKGTLYPGKNVEVFDVTGAGDTFLAALAYKYLDSGSMADAIVFANKAAAITVQHSGVYAPTKEEIE